MGIKNSYLIAESNVLIIFKKLIIKPKSLAYLHAIFHTRDVLVLFYCERKTLVFCRIELHYHLYQLRIKT